MGPYLKMRGMRTLCTLCQNFDFLCTSLNFRQYFLLLIKVRNIYFQMWSNMLLKNMHIQSLNLLSFVYIIVFNVETALEVVNLAVLKRLQLQIYFAPSQP